MRTPILGFGLAVLLASSSMAQTDHQQHMQGMNHKMSTPCPLHLTTLGLNAAQSAAFDSIRAQHKTLVHALVAGDTISSADVKRTAMEAAMKLSIAAARPILNADQRAAFDAAVARHEEEMKAMAASGMHDCLACCAHGDDHPMMKKPDV